MGNNEIQGYEPFVDELKQLIHKKQYHVLKVINAETINLYWELVEEIQATAGKRLGKINCSDFVSGITERILGSKGVFCCKFVENA